VSFGIAMIDGNDWIYLDGQLSIFPDETSETLALRCSKYFFDHSKARLTANERLFGATSFQKLTGRLKH